MVEFANFPYKIRIIVEKNSGAYLKKYAPLFGKKCDLAGARARQPTLTLSPSAATERTEGESRRPKKQSKEPCGSLLL